MKQLFTLILCLACLYSCSESPFNSNSTSETISLILDKSLERSDKVLDQQIEQLLEQMKNTVQDKPHLKPIYDVAKLISTEIEPLLIEIDLYRAEISNENGIYLYNGELQGKSLDTRQAAYQKKGLNNFIQTDQPELEGQPLNPNNKKPVKKLFVSKQKAEALSLLLKNTHKELIEAVEEITLNKDQISGVRFDRELFQELKNNLALGEIGQKKNIELLSKLSIGDCYPLLRKYQQDARTSAIQLISYLVSNMGTQALVYDEFDVLASAPKSAVFLGETYKAEIALGAYSTQAEFSVSVNDQPLPVKGGKALYQTKTNAVGEQTYDAKITIRNPLTGETITLNKSFIFEVLPR